MRTTKIRTIPRASLNALAYQGIMPCESFAQIHDTLKRHFGDSHVSAFAEPVFNKTEGFVDWYVPFEGEARPYALLSEDEKQKVTESYVAIARDIRAYADSLIETRDPQKVTRGNILNLALLYPSDDDLFLVGETPVVTCWGFGPGTQGAPVLNLCDLRVKESPRLEKEPEVAPKPSPEPERPVVRETVRTVFWPWLLPFFLLLLLLLLLFSDVGSIRSLSGTAFLHLPSLLAEDEAREKELLKKRHDLEEERRLLEARAVEHIARCRAAKIPPAGTARAPRKEELIIPENVKDTSFLTGRWLCATGLFNAQTQEPVKVEFVFNSEGKGQGHIYQKDDLCSGKASAILKDGALAITHEELRCSKGENAYAANEIVCRNTASGRTECRGKSSGGMEWNAFFLRLGTE